MPAVETYAGTCQKTAKLFFCQNFVKFPPT